MPTANAPFGFRPVGPILRANYYFITGDNSAVFLNDPVVISGSANTAEVSAVGAGTRAVGTLPSVVRSTAGSSGRVTGAVIGFCPVNNESANYRANSTDMILLVADDPQQLFEVQMDSTSAATEISGDADFTLGTGSTYTGLSGAELTGAPAASATAQFRVHHLKPQPNNELTTGFPIVVGRFKLHTEGAAAVAGV
ncbi:MAG: hypothetical protein AAFU68_02735 [Pseudomonadota bacterium]